MFISISLFNRILFWIINPILIIILVTIIITKVTPYLVEVIFIRLIVLKVTFPFLIQRIFHVKLIFIMIITFFL